MRDPIPTPSELQLISATVKRRVCSGYVLSNVVNYRVLMGTWCISRKAKLRLRLRCPPSHLHWWSFACSDAISSTDPCQTGVGFTRRMQPVAELVFEKLKARVDSKSFTFSGHCKGQVKVGDMILHKHFAIASAHTLSTPDANLTQKECFLQRFGDPRLAVELAPRSLSA